MEDDLGVSENAGTDLVFVRRTSQKGYEAGRRWHRWELQVVASVADDWHAAMPFLWLPANVSV